MRIFVIVVATAALLSLAGLAAFAADDSSRPRCDNCGMFWDKSSTRISAVIKSGGSKRDQQYCSLDCLMKATDGGSTLVKFTILNYSTAGSEKEAMLEGDKAWYLYGTKTLAGSMKPYIAAFDSEASANGARKSLGGETLSYKAMLKRYKEALAKEKPSANSGSPSSGADYYVCPCTGGCCDDVRSDKPGVCPKCGMTLVKKSEKDKAGKNAGAAQ